MGMKFEDIMCFQYIQGVRDNDLRKDPSLVKFNCLMQADMQAKITVKNMSRMIPTSSFHTPSNSKKRGVCNQRSTSSLS